MVELVPRHLKARDLDVVSSNILFEKGEAQAVLSVVPRRPASPILFVGGPLASRPLVLQRGLSAEDVLADLGVVRLLVLLLLLVHGADVVRDPRVVQVLDRSVESPDGVCLLLLLLRPRAASVLEDVRVLFGELPLVLALAVDLAGAVVEQLLFTAAPEDVVAALVARPLAGPDGQAVPRLLSAAVLPLLDVGQEGEAGGARLLLDEFVAQRPTQGPRPLLSHVMCDLMGTKNCSYSIACNQS